MKARVLIIEDVSEMAELIALYLRNEGLETIVAESAEAGDSIVAQAEVDLIVLDINLPGMDGFEFLQKLRRTHGMPVIIVSARDTDADMISGLGIGADEFVTKPFSPKVLAARVRALLRRSTQALPADAALIHFGPFTLDPQAYVLRREDARIPLSAREFEVLHYFATHPGRALNPETIYKDVWKYQYGDITAVAVYVQRLRKKIEIDPQSPHFIETVYGLGYRFDPTGNGGHADSDGGPVRGGSSTGGTAGGTPGGTIPPGGTPGGAIPPSSTPAGPSAPGGSPPSSNPTSRDPKSRDRTNGDKRP